MKSDARGEKLAEFIDAHEQVRHGVSQLRVARVAVPGLAVVVDVGEVPAAFQQLLPPCDLTRRGWSRSGPPGWRR